MKVLDLQCSHGHRFEGWFSSEDDFGQQRERSLLECPVCADRVIQRLPSAPRLNFGAQPSRAEAGGQADSTSAPAKTAQVATTEQHVAAPGADMQAQWLSMMRQVLANTEDVGERFAEEARRIHYGEAEERAIRGRASTEDTEALREEGIEVMPLHVPAALKGPLH